MSEARSIRVPVNWPELVVTCSNIITTRYTFSPPPAVQIVVEALLENAFLNSWSDFRQELLLLTGQSKAFAFHFFSTFLLSNGFGAEQIVVRLFFAAVHFTAEEFTIATAILWVAA